MVFLLGRKIIFGIMIQYYSLMDPSPCPSPHNYMGRGDLGFLAFIYHTTCRSSCIKTIYSHSRIDACESGQYPGPFSPCERDRVHYSYSEMGRHVGFHYATVSRLVKG